MVITLKAKNLERLFQKSIIYHVHHILCALCLCSCCFLCQKCFSLFPASLLTERARLWRSSIKPFRLSILRKTVWQCVLKPFYWALCFRWLLSLSLSPWPFFTPQLYSLWVFLHYIVINIYLFLSWSLDFFLTARYQDWKQSSQLQHRTLATSPSHSQKVSLVRGIQLSCLCLVLYWVNYLPLY